MQVIEISDDEVKEDVVITEVKVKLICYGMIQAPLYLYKQLPGTQKAFIRLERTTTGGIQFNFTVVETTIDVDNQEPKEVFVGYLNHSHARILSSFLGNVRFDCFVNFNLALADILVYGNRSNALYIGESLRKFGIQLKDPVGHQPKELYLNPQQQNTIQPQTNTSSSGDKMDELYASLGQSESLNTREPNQRLISTLYKYQKQALWWMYKQENSRELVFWKFEKGVWRNLLTDTTQNTKPAPIRGGILADDMGLGKTIQLISLILTDFETEYIDLDAEPHIPVKRDPFGFVPKKEEPAIEKEDPLLGSIPSNSTLIVCPLTLIQNWEEQIQQHTQKDCLKVLVHHGSNRARDPNFFLSYDVVITTYNLIGSGFGKSLSPLHQIRWHRIILDEAHNIKSSTTIQAKAAFSFKTRNRWCLTGTPIQNKIDDLYSLVKFLRIHPLDRKADFMSCIARPVTQYKSDQGFKRLQALMKGMTLRRMKGDKVDGVPILQLPTRTEHVVTLDLSTEERQLYDKVHLSGKSMFLSLQERGEVLSNFAMILKALLMMRQACLHPQLVKYDENEFNLSQNHIDATKPVSLEEAKVIYHLLRSTQEDTCVFCSNIVEAPGIYMMPCKHLVCSICFDSIFTENSRDISCSLCETIIMKSFVVEIPESEEAVADDIMTSFQTVNINSHGTKISALIQDLNMIARQDELEKRPVTKSVIFSQFTSFLSLCEIVFEQERIGFVRIDGSMSRIARNNALNRFKNDDSVTCFLISIKAGGAGLNLVAASRVYLMEPYWNPAIEQQAIDRVHRLGQTKPVTTIRFIINKSVEENMQKRQKYKIELADKALCDDELNKRGKKRKRGRDAILKEKIESLAILFQ